MNANCGARESENQEEEGGRGGEECSTHRRADGSLPLGDDEAVEAVDGDEKLVPRLKPEAAAGRKRVSARDSRDEGEGEGQRARTHIERTLASFLAIHWAP